jgi:hypothetical protein
LNTNGSSFSCGLATPIETEFRPPYTSSQTQA